MGLTTGSPRALGDRTPDLLIAKEPEGEAQKVPEGLTEPEEKKPGEDKTG